MMKMFYNLSGRGRWHGAWLAGLVGASAWAGDAFYINNGVVSNTYPPVALPVIDATNFINNGTFEVNNLWFDLAPPRPYETLNTLNYTNRQTMRSSPGFRFHTYNPAATPQRRPAASFVNANAVNDTNALVSTETWLTVSATNVVNQGLLSVGPYGQLNLSGQNVDLRRGGLIFTDTGTSSSRVYDRYWGIDTNVFSGRFNGPPLFSPGHVVTELFNQFYLFNFAQVVLPAGFTTHTDITQVGANDFLIQVVFLYNANPSIQTEVRIGFGNRAVRWEGYVTNALTGAVTTNQVFLNDRLEPFEYNFRLTNGTLLVASPNPVGAYSPYNYTVSGAHPFWNFLTPVPDSGFDPFLFQMGTNTPVLVTNSGYGTRLISAVSLPDPNVIGSVYSNVAGRIEVVADHVLDLTRTRMDVPSYMQLRAQNHFVGSTNAQIVSPASDIHLKSTNGLLHVQNLLLPVVPRMVGDMEVWSAIWTNINTAGQGLVYRVTMVNSAFSPGATPLIQDLTLRSTNGPAEVRIGDSLNISRSFLIDAERLTLLTNPPVPFSPPIFSPVGELNLMTNSLVWSDSLPRLRYLTNYGQLTTSNSVYFAGARRPPIFSSSFDEPYEAFVNHGAIASHGNDTWARYFENQGLIYSGFGPLTLRATTARFGSSDTNTFGSLIAPTADLTLQADTLAITNQIFSTGRKLSMTVTSLLTDGDTTNNTWTVRDGFNLLSKPAAGDLRGTTIYDTAIHYAQNTYLWAGEDRGRSPGGFTNNAAVGRLVLDGGYGAAFEFTGTGFNNALYVDLLELRNYATNRDAQGNLTALLVNPNMTIYYADLVADGTSQAEKFNNRNGGRLRWVSAYAGGFYGATNVVYPDNTTNRVNTALRLSQELDSDGDGLVNANDPTPVLRGQDLDLQAASVAGPPAAVLLSWRTVAGATNTVSYATSLTSPNWQVLRVTNYSQVPPSGRATLQDTLNPSAPRFYRVRVDTPQP